MHKLEVGLVGLLAGLLVGIGIVLTTPYTTEKFKSFPRENKPSVMRGYNRWGVDGIYVATEKEGEYIPLPEYLRSIKDKTERDIKEAEIKKAVGWYK